MEKNSAQVPPNAEEAKEFWNKLWDNPAPYKEDAEWLKEIGCELENVNIQDKVEIIKEDVTMQLMNIPNWKAPGLEGILGFWLKRFKGQHPRLTEVLNENIMSFSIHSWLLKNRTVRIQKDPAKGNVVGNYRSEACLDLLWKLKAVIIADKLYQPLENEDLLLEDQKGYRHVSRVTKDQLWINKAVIRNFKRRKTNLKLIGHLSPNIIELLKTELISGNINLGEMNINWDIFQGDSLSPLAFIISLIPLILLLRRMNQGYSFQNLNRL